MHSNKIKEVVKQIDAQAIPEHLHVVEADSLQKPLHLS